MLLHLSLVLLLLSTCLVVAQGNRPDYCSLPPVMEGEKQCKGYIRKWTFNETESTCASYIYGGCNGSKNLFDTEGECQAACPPSPLVPQTKQMLDASTDSTPLATPPTSASGPSVPSPASVSPAADRYQLPLFLFLFNINPIFVIGKAGE
ncbi:kunitz-type serine protease inhibitor nigrescinin-6-like isoform X2 [Daphnia pulicaria]|uniref:kunitz-type serine protease inhibitor nigrescinin-6-like isoform X2 n=1 Tax=Daphnia pulicaria TaxID=35523 RepID=UPI001EE9C741|nr:kunitz-type serine protease inhibitor nigrescinin-6-like isoform X2 [Daphnia pulicaria]